MLTAVACLSESLYASFLAFFNNTTDVIADAKIRTHDTKTWPDLDISPKGAGWHRHQGNMDTESVGQRSFIFTFRHKGRKVSEGAVN